MSSLMGLFTLWNHRYYRYVIPKGIRNSAKAKEILEDPFYAMDSELFDFQQIRFSFGEIT